jgi:GNAT superfamily N-acetyltransferase
MNIKYRIANRNDVTQIKKLSDVMLIDTGLGLATEQKILRLVTQPQVYFLLAIDDTIDEPIGFICGVKHESMFNDTKRVADLGCYVLPKYRTSRIGIKLIKQLEQWAHDQQVSEIWLGQTTGNDPSRTVKLYERLGYTVKGFNSVKQI